jgi:hypothetical protein
MLRGAERCVAQRRAFLEKVVLRKLGMEMWAGRRTGLTGRRELIGNGIGYISTLLCPLGRKFLTRNRLIDGAE